MGNKQTRHRGRRSEPGRLVARPTSTARERRSCPARPASSLTFRPNSAPLRPPSAPLHIRVTNMLDNEKLAFPLALLEGVVDNLAAASLPDKALYVQAVAHADSDETSWVGSVCWPVARDSGHFKAYVHLPQPGAYCVRLRLSTASCQLSLRFAPRQTRWFVRFHYQQPRDSHQGFDAPPGVRNSDRDACERLRFNALVLQTAVAELFHRAGLARQTFALELDDDGFPVVDVLRSAYSSVQGQRMSGGELLSHLRRDTQATETASVPGSGQRRRVKHVVILGGSHVDRSTRTLLEPKALVGGNVVASSASNMYTWPRGLEELTSCCLSSEQVAPELSVVQLAARRCFWAHYSGGLSVLLQLLGLSFGLTYRPDGVMRKDFRGLTRLLAVLEPCARAPSLTGSRRPIGDGRFAELQPRTLKPVGIEPQGLRLDELSLGMLALQCRWIGSLAASRRMQTAKAAVAKAA